MIGLLTHGGGVSTWPTFARFALATMLTVGTLTGGALGGPPSDGSGASGTPVDGGGTTLRPDDLRFSGWSGAQQGGQARRGETPAYAGGAHVGGVVFDAYRAAAAWAARTDPSCHLHWSLLAGIGHVESHHAAGVAVRRDGDTAPPILGPALNGAGDFAAIADTDAGRYDSDTAWDRAVGPMQFIPSSWRLMGVDGNGDGLVDPNNVYDAATAAARYLCAGDRDLSRRSDAQSAVYGYNHSWEYVTLVLSLAEMYASGVLGYDPPAYVPVSSSGSTPERVGASDGQPPAGQRPPPSDGPPRRVRAEGTGTGSRGAKSPHRDRRPATNEPRGGVQPGRPAGQQGGRDGAQPGTPVGSPPGVPVGPPAGSPGVVPVGPPPRTPASPPSVTPRPPSVTPRPPSVTPRPPSVTPRPPSVTPKPPQVTPKPPQVTPSPPSPPPPSPPAGQQPTPVPCPTADPTTGVPPAEDPVPGPPAENPAPGPPSPPASLCPAPAPAASVPAPDAPG